MAIFFEKYPLVKLQKNTLKYLFSQAKNTHT